MVRLNYLFIIVTLAFTACREDRIVSEVTPPLPPADSVRLGKTAPIPAAAKIAFVSERDGNSEIYAANEDGSGQVRVTYSSARDVSPAWSPDGSRLAFASDRTGAWEIYIMNADGSKLVQRTYAGFKFAQAPAWSPDGRKIAFGGTCPSDDNIYERACLIVISADVEAAEPILLGNETRPVLAVQPSRM